MSTVHAFSAGWAIYGPLPAPVEAQVGLAVAGEMDGEDWQVFEAALRHGLLTKLEDRRKALRARWNAEMGKLSPKLAGAFASGAFVDQHKNSDQRQIESAALVALLWLLSNRKKLDSTWRAILLDAHTEAMAEGVTQAHVLVSELDNLGPVDIDQFFKDTLAELKRLDAYWDPGSWLSQQVQGMAGDIGRTLAKQIESGATRQEMIDALNTSISDAEAAQFYLDEAIHTSMQQAAISIYQQAAIGYLNFQTENDDRVCPTCDSYEASNPWPTDQCPSPPVHGRCRCWSVPAA